MKKIIIEPISGVGKELTKILLLDAYMVGLVDTAMAKGEGLFWIEPSWQVALQIYRAIDYKNEFVYITKRWRLIAWLLKAMPNFIYQKL